MTKLNSIEDVKAFVESKNKYSRSKIHSLDEIANIIRIHGFYYCHRYAYNCSWKRRVIFAGQKLGFFKIERCGKYYHVTLKDSV